MFVKHTSMYVNVPVLEFDLLTTYYFSQPFPHDLIYRILHDDVIRTALNDYVNKLDSGNVQFLV